MMCCKQVKWPRGVELTLQSNACVRQYLTVSHEEQNKFLHKALNLPFELTDEEMPGADLSTMADEQRTAIPITQNGQRFRPKAIDPQSMSRSGKNPLLDTEVVSMDEHDKYEMRRCISVTLAHRPYCSAFMLMEYVPPPYMDENAPEYRFRP